MISALLGALAVVAALGNRFPLKMLPILLFELFWKVIWIVAYALRMQLDSGLDDYAAQTLLACLMGVVSVTIVLPWRYVFTRYFRAAAEPWTGKKIHSSH